MFAVNPKNGHIYLSNEDEGTATVLDPVSGKQIAVIPVGIEPEGVAVSPTGSLALVTAEATNTVHVLSIPEHEEIKTFLVGPRPREATFSPDGSVAYVTSEIGREITKFDMVDLIEIAKVRLEEVETKPKGIVLLPKRNELLVTTGRGNTVVILNAETLERLGTIGVGKRVWGISSTTDENFAFTADGLDDEVSVIDVNSRKVLKKIKVGSRPWGVVFDPGN